MFLADLWCVALLFCSVLFVACVLTCFVCFLLLFSRKHGEGFFRWVHLSCSHESHYKVSLQGIIIMKVNARSHCKEPLQGVIARSHCKESLQGVIARSHCNESLQVASAWSQVQVASARSQVQLTCEELKSLLRAAG